MLRFHDFVENTIDRERNYMARSFRLLIFYSYSYSGLLLSSMSTTKSFTGGKLVGIELTLFFRDFFTSPFVLAFLRRRSRCNSVFYVCFLVDSRAFASDR